MEITNAPLLGLAEKQCCQVNQTREEILPGRRRDRASSRYRLTSSAAAGYQRFKPPLGAGSFVPKGQNPHAPLHTLVSHRRGEKALAAWCRVIESSDIPAFKALAQTLRHDRDVVVAGVRVRARTLHR